MPPMQAGTDHIANVQLLSAKLAKYAWMNTFWAKFAGFQKITQTNGIKQYEPATNKIVQMVYDFVDEGRDTLLMAMLMPLVEEPLYGDSWLKGTGEELQLKYMNLYINQVRKAVTKLTGRAANQRLKSFKLMEKAQPELVKYWSKWYNSALFRTIVEGASPQLTAGTVNEGLGLKVRWHPNMYYHSAAGTLTSVGAEHAFKTAADLSTMANASLYRITANFLAELNIYLKTVLRIEPILYEDTEMYLMLVTPDGMKQAKADTTIAAAKNAAFTSVLSKHPAIKGRDHLFYDGICLVEERIGCRQFAKAATSTDAGFAAALAGSSGWYEPPVRAAQQMNIVLGANAIGLGIAENLNYTEEIDDHGNVREIGSQCIQGANRVEYVEDDVVEAVFSKNNANLTYYSTATPCVNQSSAIIFTGLT